MFDGTQAKRQGEDYLSCLTYFMSYPFVF